MAFLSQELVDLVVEIPNAKLSEAGVLNLRNLLRDLSNDLKHEKDTCKEGNNQAQRRRVRRFLGSNPDQQDGSS